MPFTLAHPAAVFPLRRLPFLAAIPLIIGSLTPDVATYLPWSFAARHGIVLPPTHSPLGTLIPDLPFGYLLLLMVLALRIPLSAPLWEPHRSFIRAALDNFLVLHHRWWIALPSLLIGSWTHIVWDSFTHENRFMVRNLPLLERTLIPLGDHPIAIYHLLQYLCSAGGLLLIAYWYVTALRASGLHGTGRRWRKHLLVGLLALSLLTGLGRLALWPWSLKYLSIYGRFAVVLTTAMLAFTALYVAIGLLITRMRPDPRRMRN